VLRAVEYALWFALLSGLVWLSRWRNRRNPPDAQR
jgi:hypothetical protein